MAMMRAIGASSLNPQSPFAGLSGARDGDVRTSAVDMLRQQVAAEPSPLRLTGGRVQTGAVMLLQAGAQTAPGSAPIRLDGIDIPDPARIAVPLSRLGAFGAPPPPA